MTIIEKSPLNSDNLAKIKSLFFDNNAEYRENVENLHKTLRGLRDIMMNRPELKEAIFPQFDTLNQLYVALLPPKPPYPPHW